MGFIRGKVFDKKFFDRFFKNVYTARTFFNYDTHGRVGMGKPIKIRVDICFFG